MKIRLAGFVVAGCLAAVSDSLWVGGASGNWGDAKNWRDGAVPNGADAVARIESAADVTISVGSGTYTVGASHVSGGRHKIVGTGFINLDASSGTGVVEVAENAWLTTGCRLDAAAAVTAPVGGLLLLAAVLALRCRFSLKQKLTYQALLTAGLLLPGLLFGWADPVFSPVSYLTLPFRSSCGLLFLLLILLAAESVIRRREARRLSSDPS